MSIRRRLLLLLLPALAVLMLAGALVDRWVATASTQAAYDQALASSALAAAALLQADPGPQRPLGLARTLGWLRQADQSAQQGEGATRFIAISGPHGERLAGSAQLASLTIPTEAGRPSFANAVLDGQPVRLVRVRLTSRAGDLLLTLAESRARRERTEHVMLFGKLLVDFAELDVTLLVVWLAVHWGLQPLGRLRTQVEASQARTVPGRFDPHGVPAELRPLVASFNQVLELLHAAAGAQQRFLADAAHQLRTPLAGLAAQIELLCADSRARELGAQLHSLQRGAQALARSANQLLALARAEPASAQEEPQTVALEALVGELIEGHLDQALRAGVDLGAEVQPVSVRGYPWLLQDLLGNLIDNALKYTPRDGRVTVRCGKQAGAAWIEVEDDGPGIPAAERQRVCDRFYRRPGSAGSGAGLGLAIVEEIARLHGGRLSIEDGAGGRGARMRVSLPT